jgi:hypothetical protein
MNERIESLWKDATSYANEATSDLDVWHEIRRKKFAELIVRECIANCADLDSMKYIANHFGIKVKGLE